jgi:glutathione S-transferase
MAKYLEVEEAFDLPGLRVVLTPTVPGPFSESAKGILHVKKLPYIKVRQHILGDNPGMVRWCGQTSAPVAIWNHEPPRSTWIEQLFLFERLGPEPRLIPADFDLRVLMFGLANEINGENGFTWNRRHIMVRDFTRPGIDAQTSAIYKKLGEKYWYSDSAAAAAPGRCAEVMVRLNAQLERQRSLNSRYFIGHSLSALDIYWACVAAMLEPLPDALCPFPEQFRSVYTNTDHVLRAATTGLLMAHRDYIYQRYLELPVDL